MVGEKTIPHYKYNESSMISISCLIISITEKSPIIKMKFVSTIFCYLLFRLFIYLLCSLLLLLFLSLLPLPHPLPTLTLMLKCWDSIMTTLEWMVTTGRKSMKTVSSAYINSFPNLWQNKVLTLIFVGWKPAMEFPKKNMPNWSTPVLKLNHWLYVVNTSTPVQMESSTKWFTSLMKTVSNPKELTCQSLNNCIFVFVKFCK